MNCQPRHSVFLFLEKFNITQYISALPKPKNMYVQSQNNALGKIQVRYFFAQNCEICMIRAPPVLFERKNSNRTEENTLDNNDVYSYRIESKNETERYYVSFINANNELTETEVPKDTFLALQEFNRKRESLSRSDRRHIEKSEQTEISLNVKNIAKQLSMDETTMRNIRNRYLHQAISKLTKIQQRRLRMYFFEGHKLREIAVYENCSPQAVHKSIKRGLIKLRGILSKNNQ